MTSAWLADDPEEGGEAFDLPDFPWEKPVPGDYGRSDRRDDPKETSDRP
jgi:hypothetical protein